MNAPILASQKQADFLASLCTSRVVPPSVLDASAKASLGTLSAHDASRAIETATKCAFVKSSPTAEKGYYLVDGDVFVVMASKETGKLYAKKLVISGKKGSWVYAPGMIYKLKPEQKLTLEEAAKIGHATGVCAICGRTLSDEKSVAQGVGPVCIKRL